MSYDPMPETMRKTVAKELHAVADEIERGDWDVRELWHHGVPFWRVAIAWGLSPAGYIEMEAEFPVQEKA